MVVGGLESRVPSEGAEVELEGHAVELEGHLRPRRPRLPRPSSLANAAAPAGKAARRPAPPPLATGFRAPGRRWQALPRSPPGRFTGGGPGEKPSQTRGVTPRQPGRAWGSPSARLLRRVEEPGGPTRTSLWGPPARGSTRRHLPGRPDVTERTWARSPTPDPYVVLSAPTRKPVLPGAWGA
ncbi:proline-rich proteoglycan 2-like [Panthera tigris]|uniref:proline-rich proteoglycan 2-like n=1 Tax=Panthera tigris TaxID=9694 RepID=UPI001C6FBD1B|nr:proline-rich proteoglycan 2-like [Panthera tigris]